MTISGSIPEKAWRWHGGDGAMIWQLMFSSNGKVMGLKRSSEERRATLFCLEAATGRILCDDFVLADPSDMNNAVGNAWMIGLETTYADWLVCHAYQPGSPEHQGIWAVDLPVKTIVWCRPDLVFAANLGDRFLVYRTRVFAGFPERDYFLLDPETGQEIEADPIEQERAHLLRSEAASEQERQGIVLPDSGVNPDAHVEFIHYGTMHVTAFHRERLTQAGHLVWDSFLEISSANAVLYQEQVATSFSVPAVSNFLIKDERLYYIREKSELISVPVS
jgi:hypothetical protein